MNGKGKCKILKNIRKKIAEENDITYVTSECKYQGDCSGTCPKCEAELRYLEEELAKRRNLGKAVAVAGIAAAIVVGAAGCASASSNQTEGPSQDTSSTTKPAETIDDELGGAVLPTDLIMGDIDLSEDPTDATDPVEDPTDVLMGDVDLSEDPT